LAELGKVSNSFRVHNGVSVDSKTGAAEDISIDHNNRKFFAENVNKERSHLNKIYAQKNVKEIYRELFDEAVKEFNSKQKRADRKIADYYEKIESGKYGETNPKPYYELLVQFGDMYNAGIGTDGEQIGIEMLDKYMRDFQKRNPNLRVFNAVMHLDEASPHLHINFIPFAENKSWKMPRKVSLRNALEQQGFDNSVKGEMALIKWTQAEKKVLEEIIRSRELSVDRKGIRRGHYSVEDFKKSTALKQMKENRVNELLKKSNAGETLSPEEAALIKNHNELLQKKSAAQEISIKELEDKLRGGLIFRKVIPDEKLHFVMEELQKSETPFAEDLAGLHVPNYALPLIAAAEKNYKPAPQNWKDGAKLLIDQLVYKVNSVDELLNELGKRGYIVRRGKYVSLKPSKGNFKAARLHRFGDEYTEESLRRRIANKDNFKIRVDERAKNSAGLSLEYTVAIVKTVALVYTLAKPPRKWKSDKPYSVENDYHINKLAAQLRFIDTEKILSADDLNARIERLQTEIDAARGKAADMSKTQINLKDLIAKATFYYNAQTSGRKLDTSEQMKFAVAKEILEEYGIATGQGGLARLTEIISELKGSLIKNEKSIADLAAEAAEFSKRQDLFLEMQKTLDSIRSGEYFGSLREQKEGLTK
jgi:hypothetical protein